MRLYLVQHGEARSEDVDPQRHLTEAGLRNVAKVADFLRPLKLSVDAIWHSGKPRAQQTAEILSSSLSAHHGVVQRDELSPNDPIRPTREAIAHSKKDLMIVGHLPFLSKLAASLVTSDKSNEIVAFRYGGVVCLERDDADQWKVAWMITPDLLPSG